MATDNAKVEKIILDFKFSRETKRTHMFEEELGEETWSDQDVAVGNLYIKTQALELIGKPTRIKVTIEPVE